MLHCRRGSTDGAAGYDLCASENCVNSSKRQGASADWIWPFRFQQVSTPELLQGQDLPLRNSLMLGQVLSIQ